MDEKRQHYGRLYLVEGMTDVETLVGGEFCMFENLEGGAHW